jgi:hypothetical protein
VARRRAAIDDIMPDRNRASWTESVRVGPSRRVAVGTPVARRPPHGSGRAELPHPALALGPNVEPLVGPGVGDPRSRKGSDERPKGDLNALDRSGRGVLAHPTHNLHRLIPRLLGAGAARESCRDEEQEVAGQRKAAIHDQTCGAC